jgi:hypothetical protein
MLVEFIPFDYHGDPASIGMLKIPMGFKIFNVSTAQVKKSDSRRSSLNGNRTRISTLRGSRPKPLDDKAIKKMAIENCQLTFGLLPR